MIKILFMLISTNVFLSAYEGNQTYAAADSTPPKELELSSYVTERDINGFIQYLEKHHAGFDRRQRVNLYDEIILSDDAKFFAALNHYIRYSDNRLIDTLDKLGQSLKYMNYAKIILSNRPYLLPQILLTTILKEHYCSFMFILSNYATLIDEDTALQIFIIALKNKKRLYTEELLAKLRRHATTLCNEIFILACYFKDTFVVRKILANHDIKDEAICAAYSNGLGDDTAIKWPKHLKKRIDTISESNLSDQAPIFNNIRSSRFLNLHNAMLFHNGELYRIRFHLSAHPFCPPYIVVFDHDESNSCIKLQKLSFSKPLKSIGKSFIYQAENSDLLTTTMFVELDPIGEVLPHQFPDVWQLNSDNSDFTLIVQDERFRDDSLLREPLVSDGLDPDEYVSLDESNDSAFVPLDSSDEEPLMSCSCSQMD